MAKEVLKRTLYKKQNGHDALTGKKGLPVDTELMDTHRKKPKHKGGIYTTENTVVTSPIAHMIEHGNLRIRTTLLNEVKKLVDAREHAIKLKNKVDNQLRAYKRNTDDLDKELIVFLETQSKLYTKETNRISSNLEKTVKAMIPNDPLVRAGLGLKGIGPVTIAYCLVYIDLEKARHASSLWSYAGLHKASHERYEKTVAGGGNKRLRTVLYTMADSQVKSRGPYRVVYDNMKNRLEKSERITKSRNTQGKLIECAWKDTKPCHRHGAAMRAIMKHFLADYWYVGRSLMGLPVDALYPEAILKGNHRTIMPEERGWVYKK